MPSTSSNAAHVLLLAPSDASLLATDEDTATERVIALPAAPRARRPALLALAVSVLLHGLVAVALWQWTAALVPAPDKPVLHVRLRKGGGEPTPPPVVAAAPATPAPVAAAKPPRPPATPPRSRAPAKTATTPAAAPLIASQPPLPPEPPPATAEAQAPGSPLAEESDPLVNTATVRVLEWLAQHRRYPGPARRARLQGTVEIVVVLMPDGRLVDQRVVQSSGHAVLDKAALDLLRRASPVPTSAFFAGEARQLELRLPIIYRLSI